MTQVLIFDLDGTLIDSSEYYFALDQEVYRRMGLEPPTHEEYFTHFGIPHHSLMKTLRPQIDLDEYDKISNSLVDLSSIRTFPEAKGAIEELSKKKHRLGVLSSGNKQFVEGHLRNNGILEHFEYIHGADSSPYIKPDPRVFDDIVDHFSVPRPEIIYIGDLVTDFQAANGANIPFIAVTTGHHDEKRFEAIGCSNIIASLAQLQDAITHPETKTS